jgi:hypothetical protein
MSKKHKKNEKTHKTDVKTRFMTHKMTKIDDIYLKDENIRSLNTKIAEGKLLNLHKR